MSRVFEEAYRNVFSEAPKAISYLLALVLIIATILRRTPDYIVAFIAFYAFFYWVGYRLWTRLGIFQVTSFALGISALLDLLTSRPPLSSLLVSSVIAASMAMSLRCREKLYLAPLAVSAFFFLAVGRFIDAVLAAIYAATMPALRAYLARQVKGGDALCMFNSFIYSSVSPEGLFDYAFKPLGVKDRGALSLYLFSGGGRRLVVVSDFHPGPLRNIGGGLLVNKLVSKGLRMGYDVVFIHGVGGHERDPVSSDEVDKIVDAALREASRMRGVHVLSGIEARSIVIGDVRLTTFPLGVGPPLAIVSRVKAAADDIPLSVAKAVDSRGFVLVDAQNKFNGPLVWSQEDVASLQAALEKASEARRCGDFKIGLGFADASFIDPLHLELGVGGINAIIAKCDSSKYLLVVIDGNNIDSNLYNKIINKYSNKYNIVEVVTTDTHAMTGYGFGKGYRVVGEGINDEHILEVIDRAVRKAEEDLGHEKAAAYSRIEVEAEVFGENFAQLRGVVERYKRISAVVLTYLLSSVVFALLL